MASMGAWRWPLLPTHSSQIPREFPPADPPRSNSSNGGVFPLEGSIELMKIDSIQTWALEEARRRLEIEGILEDPSPEK